jgi:hypothetical protein
MQRDDRCWAIVQQTFIRNSLGKVCFLCGPCRGVILKTSGATQAVLGQFLSECSDIHVSRKLKERIETRSREEYKRSACEDVKCELKVLFEVCHSVRLNM